MCIRDSPDAIVRYHASDMQLHVHSDASYLSESQARSRAGGTFFLSSNSKDPKSSPDPNSIPPPHNGAIHTHCSIIKSVLSSATEAELGALFYNAKDGAMLQTTLEDMGHPQQATPIQTDNACAAGIANNTVKQRRSKAIDMRFYWIRDRVNQGQFLVHWRRGTDNLADYFTKHHSPLTTGSCTPATSLKQSDLLHGEGVLISLGRRNPQSVNRLTGRVT